MDVCWWNWGAVLPWVKTASTGWEFLHLCDGSTRVCLPHTHISASWRWEHCMPSLVPPLVRLLTGQCPEPRVLTHVTGKGLHAFA